MKILMIETGGWGGILHYSFNLMEALAKSGVDVVLATNEKYELEGLPSHFRVIRIFKREAYWKTLWKLFRLLKREKPDLVHVQSPIAPRKDWIWFFFLPLLKIKLVLTAHNVLPHETRPLDRFCHRLMYRAAHGIIVHSQANREEIGKVFPSLSPDRLRTIPHGHYAFFSGTPPSKGEARRGLGLPLDKKIVLFFGAVREYKGLDILMEAAASILKLRSDVLFLAVGMDLEGKRDRYLELHETLNLGEGFRLRFQYVPFQEVSRYFFAADLAVLPYRAIYQSGILLLSMSCGVPVVASRVGAFPETLEEGKSGVLVAPGNAEELQKGILSVLDDPGRLETLGKRGKELAEKNFSWEAIAEKTVRFYREVLNEGR